MIAFNSKEGCNQKRVMSDPEDARPSKRLKILEQGEEGGNQLGFDPPVEKEAGNEEDDNDSAIVSGHANDRIDLLFHTLSIEDAPNSHCVHPQYTHQLFPDETISYLNQKELRELKIQIHINSFDLQHWVDINGVENPFSLQKLQQDLQIGTPEGTVFCHRTSNEILPTFSTSFLTEHSFPPSGQRIHSFTRISPSNSSSSEEYEVYLASYQDNQAPLLLTRLEKLAMWFIETADSVDFQDPRWEVLFLYRKYHLPVNDPDHDDRSTYYGLVGYMTLFTFHNPFHGDSLRVCQALIFPEHQHAGFGRELLLSVYRLAKERSRVTQVTVEDPSPGFQQLRNMVDFEWFMIQYLPPNQDPVQELQSMTMISIKELMETLKIIKPQAIFVKEAAEYLLMILFSLDSSSSSALSPFPSSSVAASQTVMSEKDRLDAFLSSLTDQIAHHEKFPEFRLRVKKQLVKTDPELKELPKEILQKELSVAFEEKMIQYRKVLKVALRLQLLSMKKKVNHSTVC